MLVRFALTFLTGLAAAAPCAEGVRVVENCKNSGQVAWTFDGESVIPTDMTGAVEHSSAQACRRKQSTELGARGPGAMRWAPSIPLRATEASGRGRLRPEGGQGLGRLAPRGA